MAASTQAPNAWRVLALLFAANLLNFFDRTLPAVVAEPIRREWGLNDFELGLISTSFVLVYAVAGLPLGRWVDHGSRRVVLALGLAVWSLFTGLAGLASTFVAFLWLRAMVGIGEASYAPAANSLVGDLFPSARRARAVGLFMLGLPIGLLVTYFAVGPIVVAFQSWRAPFYLAAIPGLLLAFACLRIREPARGAADAIAADRAPPPHPFRALMRIPTLWCLIGSGLSINFAAYAANAFLVPLFMRHFGLALTPAANLTGLICGATGLIALAARRLDRGQAAPALRTRAAALRRVLPGAGRGGHDAGPDRGRRLGVLVHAVVRAGLAVLFRLLPLRVPGPA